MNRKYQKPSFVQPHYEVCFLDAEFATYKKTEKIGEKVVDVRNVNKVISLGIISEKGEVVFDGRMKPEYEKDVRILNCGRAIHGLDSEDIFNSIPSNKVRERIQNLVRNKIIVGYGLRNDFEVTKYYSFC